MARGGKGRTVVVVVGMPGSGKSVAAGMLKGMGFSVIELGDIWRELLAKNGIPRSDVMATREFTRKLRERFGKDVYAKRAFGRIRGMRGRIAIMGVRSTYEADYLKSRIKDLSIIALVAPVRTRFGRIRARGKPEDAKSFKEFAWIDTREKRGFMKAKSEERHGVMRIIKESDFVISNTSTSNELRKSLKAAVSEIESRSR